MRVNLLFLSVLGMEVEMSLPPMRRDVIYHSRKLSGVFIYDVECGKKSPSLFSHFLN